MASTALTSHLGLYKTPVYTVVLKVFKSGLTISNINTTLFHKKFNGNFMSALSLA